LFRVWSICANWTRDKKLLVAAQLREGIKKSLLYCNFSEENHWELKVPSQGLLAKGEFFL